MASKRRRRGGRGSTGQSVSDGEAGVLFNKLVELGHVSAAQIHEARQAIAREVAELSERLRRWKGAAVAAIERKPPQHASERSGEKPKRKAAVSARRMQSMQLQGRYMRALLNIPKNQRAKYKAMIAKRGKLATVEAMEKAAK